MDIVTLACEDASCYNIMVTQLCHIYFAMNMTIIFCVRCSGSTEELDSLIASNQDVTIDVKIPRYQGSVYPLCFKSLLQS